MSGNSSLDTSESKFLVLISASCHTYNHTYANDFLGLQVGRCILHVIILIIVVPLSGVLTVSVIMGFLHVTSCCLISLKGHWSLHTLHFTVINIDSSSSGPGTCGEVCHATQSTCIAYRVGRTLIRYRHLISRLHFFFRENVVVSLSANMAINSSAVIVIGCLLRESKYHTFCRWYTFIAA